MEGKERTEAEWAEFFWQSTKIFRNHKLVKCESFYFNLLEDQGIYGCVC